VNFKRWSRGRLVPSAPISNCKSTRSKNVHVSLEIGTLSQNRIHSNPPLCYSSMRMLDLKGRFFFLCTHRREMIFTMYATTTRKMTESKKFESYRKWTKKGTTDLGNPHAEQKSVDAVWKSIGLYTLVRQYCFEI